MEAASLKYDGSWIWGRLPGWRAGCIIRANFLSKIAEEYKNNPKLPNLMAAPSFSKFISKSIASLSMFTETARSAEYRSCYGWCL